MPVATSFVSPPLGHSIPYYTPHAVSVSLPTWADNVGYEEGEKRVVEAMQTGYPRFFVHKSIQKLAGIAAEQFAEEAGHRCYLYPTKTVAEGCLSFLESRQPAVRAYIKEWCIRGPALDGHAQEEAESQTVYCVFVTSADDFSVQKQFWQHTGDGISSRLAERCLSLLGVRPPGSPTNDSDPKSSSSTSGPSSLIRGFSRNKHYAKKASAALEAVFGSSQPMASTSSSPVNGSAQPGDELATYIEERYARNLSATQAPLAKVAMKRRIAGVLKESERANEHIETNGHDMADSVHSLDRLTGSEVLQPSTRGVSELSQDDVFLYPQGMSAIFHSFQSVLAAHKAKGKGRVGKSVCFGFPYTDTLKILQKWGPGCHFFGRGLDSDLPALEDLLREKQQRHAQNPDSDDPDDKPILALFCEFPSNPLLRSPNLEKLRSLADKYNFYIVVDETVGGFINVETLPLADIVVSSLTKIFSGDSNVSGGSLVLNPKSPEYSHLKETLSATYEDTYYAEDAVFMERNSRDFRPRVAKINSNAEIVCDFLSEHAVAAGKSLTGSGVPPVLTKVYYPKYITSDNYLARKRQDCPEAGFGGLFSVTFSSLGASRAFFDALQCCKGPSLGTNFTLACPYTVLAHYLELEWAKEWEVEEGLVRVSIGLEDPSVLREWFSKALLAAEAAR